MNRYSASTDFQQGTPLTRIALTCGFVKYRMSPVTPNDSILWLLEYRWLLRARRSHLCLSGSSGCQRLAVACEFRDIELRPAIDDVNDAAAVTSTSLVIGPALPRAGSGMNHRLRLEPPGPDVDDPQAAREPGAVDQRAAFMRSKNWCAPKRPGAARLG